MSRGLCFISAPFAPYTYSIVDPDASKHDRHVDVVENVRRAFTLAKLARDEGYVPIVPHLEGLAGLYGGGVPMASAVTWNGESVLDLAGLDADEAAGPAGRAEIIESCCVVVEAVAMSGGVFWLLQRADGTLSSGCQKEAEAFGRASDQCRRQGNGVMFRWDANAAEGARPTPVNEVVAIVTSNPEGFTAETYPFSLVRGSREPDLPNAEAVAHHLAATLSDGG